MRGLWVCVAALISVLPTLGEAQFITPDANAILHVYWDNGGIQDAFGSTWGAEGSPSLASAEFGYAAGAEGFTATDFYFNGSDDAQPSWNPPYSVMDFTADECVYDPWTCGSPSFTAVLAFKNTGGTTNPGQRFLLSDVTYGTGNGWYLYTQSIPGVGGRERIARFSAPGLIQSANVNATDTSALTEGEGLQVICFGIDENLTPKLEANGRTMVSGSPGIWENMCDPPVEDPSCYAAFMPSYGPGYLGLHDGFGTAWKPALFKTFYEFYMTRSPISGDLCDDLRAEIVGE